jgi:ankyrin repeat protein
LGRNLDLGRRKWLLQWEDDEGNTAFHKAMLEGNVDVVGPLIRSLPEEKHSIAVYLLKKNRAGQSPLGLIREDRREAVHKIITDEEIPMEDLSTEEY